MIQHSARFISLLLIIGGCHTTPPPLPPPKAVPAIGSSIALAAGAVFLTADGKQERIITGAMLPEEAVLTLDTGARALIRLTDGTGIFVRDNTELRLSNGDVRLIKGEIWVDVPPDETALKRITAGTVTVTAAGAGFDLALREKHAEIYVARGLAVVKTPTGRAEVESGEKAIVDGENAKPDLEPMKFFADWTGGMADRELSAGIGGRATGRIYGINRANPGALPTELDILSQDIQVVIRDGIAHTTVDQRFFNSASADVEGWYWFTIPEGAAVERFALDVNGVLVEGEMTERKQAAEAYEEAVSRAVDPALLEWVDGRNFRARIFPVPAAGERRVVLSYTQILSFADHTYRYVYPMGGPAEKRIQEFSLQVDIGPYGKRFDIATLQEARVSKAGDLITIRRSGYLPKADFLLELKQREKIEPLRAYRFSSGGNEADYLMVRYAPEENFGAVEAVPGDVVVVVDTSAGGGESERQIRTEAAEAILRALADDDRFAIVSADLSPKVIYPEKGLAPATAPNVGSAMERLSEVSSAGATDLGEMFHVAFDLVHDAVQPAVVYIGDGRPTVGETDPLALTERLRRSLGESRARLFTLAVGEASDHALLERMAKMGGGRAFRIDTPEQTVQEALHFVGLVKTPTITDLHIDLGAGLDQAFSTVAGKISEGEEVVVLARSHHEIPKRIAIRGRLGGAPFERTYASDVETGSELGYIAPLWARMYLERLMGEGLEENRGTIISLGLNYYLMTPFTSFLVLDSDDAYEAAGIPRRNQAGRFWSGFGDTAFKNDTPRQISVAEGDAIPAVQSMAGATEDSVEAAPEYEEVLAPAPVASASPAKIAPPRPRLAAKQRRSTKKASARREAPSMDDDLFGGAKAAMGTSGPMIAAKPQPRYRTIDAKGICSDAAKRPLHQRRIIWARKIARAVTPSDLADIFFDAARQCELPRMRARQSLLSMIEAKAHTADEIRALLTEFSGQPGLQRYLRRRILQRTLNTEIDFGLYESGTVNWYEVQRGLGALKTAEERLKKIESLLETEPEDTAGRLLLVDALIEVGKKQDALAVASKLKRDGFSSTYLLEIICDLQAEAGDIEAAKRTCSELVEFSEADPVARRRLGDLFLRHGWFEAAYRQYKTLVTIEKEIPEAWLRLAIAAAGMGKVDEALRIERKVATFDGEGGPKDPRRFARLHSTVRLARMMVEATSARDEAELDTLTRNLKRTQLFSAPTTMVLLTWTDLDTPLSLYATKGDAPIALTDDADAAQTGLYMLSLGERPMNGVSLEARIDKAPIRRAVPFSIITIAFDGEHFSVTEKKATLPARAKKLPL